MIEIRDLNPENLDQAMQMVTESYDLDARRGWKDDDFREDWLIQYRKFEVVAHGFPFVGLVGYQNYNQPIAISLMIQSPAYGADTGVWEWFFISPRAKRASAIEKFPRKLTKETFAKAVKRGAENFVAFVGKENRDAIRAVEGIGMKPVEVEYRGQIDSIKSTFRQNGKLEKSHAK
ncbi:MAG: GNAT family N-acetyltransferase [Planctomycetota bacterium]|jgi:hypothetical protein